MIRITVGVANIALALLRQLVTQSGQIRVKVVVAGCEFRVAIVWAVLDLTVALVVIGAGIAHMEWVVTGAITVKLNAQKRTASPPVSVTNVYLVRHDVGNGTHGGWTADGTGVNNIGNAKAGASSDRIDHANSQQQWHHRGRHE